MFGPGAPGGPGLPFMPGFNPGQTQPLDPSDPRAQMPPQFANVPPRPFPDLGSFNLPPINSVPGMGGMSGGPPLTNLPSLGGGSVINPNYAMQLMQQGAAPNWLQWLILQSLGPFTPEGK